MHLRRIIGLAALVCLLATSSVMAQEGEPQTMSWFEMFFLPPGDVLGTLMIWVILLMSAVSVSLIIRFGLQFRRSMLVPETTRVEIESLIAEKKYRDAIEYAQNDPSYLGRLTSAALTEAANGYGAMERAIEESGDYETTRYLRPVEYLNVLGNIGPMMGLFGTVYGMIRAFQSLVAKGGQPDPADLAGGIATALVTTFWGLVVAIPALAAYSVIRNKIDAITSEGMLIAEDMISPFKPGGKKDRKERDRSGERSSRPRATPKPEPEVEPEAEE